MIGSIAEVLGQKPAGRLASRTQTRTTWSRFAIHTMMGPVVKAGLCGLEAAKQIISRTQNYKLEH